MLTEDELKPKWTLGKNETIDPRKVLFFKKKVDQSKA